MQISLPLESPPAPARHGSTTTVIVVGRRTLTVACVRHPRARRYLLRVEDDGSVRVTLPRRGSRAEALRFVREKVEWIERERYRRAMERATAGWLKGSRAMIDGEWVDLAGPGGSSLVLEGREEPLGGDPAAAAARLLRAHAARTLPARLLELAAQQGFDVAAVTVRDQSTRWGSCSPSGRISLNWRLAQMPPPVRDYVLLHELAHLRHPDHSRRFWAEVERICPSHREARRWLAENGGRGCAPSPRLRPPA